MNPEYRQRLNTISRNLETAGEVAQENIYTFTQLYIDPCLEGFKLCLHDCTAPCFPRSREERLRRRRGQSRGRAEANFDFYDDWDDEEDVGNNLVGWGNDELDSLLAGNKAPKNRQPPQQKAMSYGSRGRRPGTVPGEPEQDPTLVPSSSYFGFLERLPFKIGAKGIRYKPSAADLQENPGGVRIRDVETEPLIEEEEDDSLGIRIQKTRQRSGTAGSGTTQTSHSSRGDLIPSDEEADAVPLDDEFAVMLSRRITNIEETPHSGKSSKRPRTSRTSTRPVSSRTASSASAKSAKKSRRSSSKKSLEPMSPGVREEAEPPPMIELSREEDKIRIEEETEIEQKRIAAQKAASKQNLPTSEAIKSDDVKETVNPPPVAAIPGASPNAEDDQDEERVQSRPQSIPSRKSSGSGPEPFPDYPSDE